MKKKFLIGATVILIVITTLLSLITTSRGANNWYVEQDEIQGVSWYYEVVSNEAVNVRTTGNANAKRIRKLIVPQTLGGYPVTRIQGEVGWMGSSIRNIVGLANDSLPLVEEVVLPEGLKTIGHDSFRKCVNLKKINIPSTLEKIEGLSFEEVVLDNLVIDNPNLQLEDYTSITVKNLEVKDIETCNLNVRFGGIKVTESINVEGVKNLIKCAVGCAPTTEVTISSDIEKISKYAITGPTDGYVDKYEEEVELVDYSLNVDTGILYHFKNVEKVKTNLPEGIKAIDVNKNEEFTVAKVGTGSDFKFKLEQEDGYNYEDYTVFIEDVVNYDLIEGAKGTVQKINVRFGEEYTIENVKQYKKIHVQLRKDELDLNLKQYVWGINNQKMNNSREPVAKIQEDGSIEYKTNKNALYVKYGDKVRYGIKVYNEGTIDGTANKITVQIPEGLIFNQDSEINAQYGWVKLDDGRTVTTEYLNNKAIDAYSIYNKIDSEEIFIDLDVEVVEETVDRTLVTEAQITQASGIEEDTEDDKDTEAVTTSRNTTQPFELVVNKIDGIDNKLLNGATFDLLDENKNVIKTGVTADGGKINFGTVYAYGYQKTRYYIRETYTPEGYKNHLKYLIRLDVVPTYSDISANNRVDFELDVQYIDVETSKYETIEISTKEELRAIESNKEEKYVITQDIDLEGSTWTPINVENVKLDGQGHKITNLKIEGDADANKKVGLFATYSGIIENLTVEGVDINITKNLKIPENPESVSNYIQGVYDTQESEDDIPAVGGIIGYSENVILKNCKVTGNVKTEFKNVGGLVGHSEEGTITVFINCTNEANVLAKKEYQYPASQYQNGQATIIQKDGVDGSNAGGMIGVVLGPVYVTNCKNTGTIETGKYNAGGMIGSAESKRYTTKNVFGQCEDKLNIYVKNEKITGKYKITINKIDSEEKNLLQGAKFTVYDSEKRPIEGYENVELENGTLTIPETIERTGTDIFYIKETQAPEGYVPLTDTYIKVEVEKTWDREEQKYETETTCTALTEREMEQDTANTSEVVVNEKITNTENSNVTLKTDDVTIDQGTVNEGNVTAGKLDAGGFVGHAKCSVEVTDSINNGEVSVEEGIAGGIVGQIIADNGESTLLYANNVQNNGNIIQKLENDNPYTESIAGIAAVVNSDVEIYNSKNTGEINAIQSSMAGIVGTSYSNLLTIDNCENTGDMTSENQSSSNSNNGGILGKSFPYDINPNGASNPINRNNSIHKITNCRNTGTFTVASHTGGIVGHGSSKTLEISNCTVSDTSIEAESGNFGGIIGNSENEVLNIHDNNIIRFKVTKEGAISYGSTGGVLGESCAIGNIRVNNQTVKIDNCNVEELDTTTVKSNGGIVGQATDTKTIEISRCNVNGQLKLVGNNNTSGDVAGILASAKGSGSNLKVTDCNINSCNIYNYSSGIDTAVSGCLGDIGTSSDILNSVECTNVKVINTNIMQQSEIIDNEKNVAGILAYAAANYINIEDSDLDNVKLEQHSGNVGGIVSVVCYGQSLTIDGCDSNKLTIDNNISGVTSSSSGSGAGILLMAGVPTTVVENCNVVNATMEGTSQLSGGIAWAKNNTTISNVKLEDSTITGNGNPNNGSMSTFNVAGLVTTGHGTITMEDCLVKDCSISSNTINTAGMVSHAQDRITMANCEVNNTKVENKFPRTDYTTSATGGMVANSNGSVTMNNCKIINGSQVLSKCSNTGGLIGNSQGARLTKCNVDNISIVTDKMTGSNQDVGGIAGTIEGYTYLDECSVTGNTRIESVATNAAGLVGTVTYLYQCKDCKVEDVTINNGAAANSSKATGVAGMIGTTRYNTNCNLENATVKNVSLTSSSDSISGVMGYNYFNNIKNANIDGIILTHTNKVGYSTSTGRGVAGITVSPQTATTIQSSTIKNITINIENGSIPYISASGLIGYTWNGVNIDEDTVISDINITNNTNGSTAGIIATYGASSNLEIPKLEGFNNITVRGKQNAGGILAYTNSGVDIDKLTGNNITVVGENYVGGLFGMQHLPSNDWTIENVDLSNVNVSGKGNVGGILGGGAKISSTATVTTKTVLNNINISNGTIINTGIDTVTPKSPYTVNGKTYNHTGGVIGNTLNAELNNINLTDFDIKLNEDTEEIEEDISLGNLYEETEEEFEIELQTNSANYFVESEGKLVPNNLNAANGTIALSYVEIDLTDKTGKYKVDVETEGGSGAPFWGIVTQDAPANDQSYQTFGKLFYIVQKQIVEKNDYIMTGGNKYYLTIGYLAGAPTDDAKVKSIKLKKFTGALVINGDNFFAEKEGEIVPTNLAKGDRSYALSYVEIDLTGKSGIYNLDVNVEGKSSAPFWAILTENAPADKESYSTTEGRLFYIVSNQNTPAQEYRKTLQGNTKYYLTFGYKSDSTGDNVKINSINLEKDMTISMAEGNVGGVVGNVEVDLVLTEVTINKATKEKNNILGNANYVGALLGYGKVTTDDINISDVQVNSKNCNAIGTIGFIATGSDVKNINLNNSIINSVNGYVGGIAGLANDNITSCTVTDSEIKLTVKNGSTGGILGHGSNITGTDVTIEGCKVIDSKITGYNQVGGISGGAVIGIINCYVGGKEGETFEAGQYAVKIKGNSAVGGIVGDAGIISNDNQQMLTMTGTNIYNSLIEGKQDVDELVGIHGRFDEEYTTGSQTENISTSTATNCRVNIITE
ncbi:MAG: leucine-rich repeat protein [Clostridia bacterium]|nr:leucine-rich repeat protein [Clostridia bacterium]